jgi:uncharacterized membrane protein YeaQ/YmgE (transglycosylase-associated protein family)
MEQMGWIAWLVVGAIAGWLASRVVQSRHGLLGNIIVGVIGAVIGGFLFNQVGIPGATGFNAWSIGVAFSGACVLLGLIQIFGGGRRVFSR